MRKSFVLAVVLLAAFRPAQAQKETVTYDESRIPPYELPDPLVFENGKTVRCSGEWTRKRRAEVLEIFAGQMYGHVPGRPEGEHFKVLEEAPVYGGIGIRKCVRIYLDAAEAHWFDVLVHLPAAPGRRYPVITGLNFRSNPGTLDDREGHRWPYEMILRCGFGVATAWRDAIEPDGKDRRTYPDAPVAGDGGVREWFHPGGDWGAISAWAWGLSRIADYLETDPCVDASRLAVIGHSRLGKTALWASANDLRFRIAISNCSGCCGAALSRRRIGENFAVIDSSFPHWFTRAFDPYQGHEDLFPADQHELIALSAPRPVYVGSATEDRWADPRGEWLSLVHARSVYALFGKKGPGRDGMPEPGVPDMDGDLAYHIRTGRHDITAWDWQQYLTFAARYFFK